MLKDIAQNMVAPAAKRDAVARLPTSFERVTPPGVDRTSASDLSDRPDDAASAAPASSAVQTPKPHEQPERKNPENAQDWP
jgi:hypothetical protein